MLIEKKFIKTAEDWYPSFEPKAFYSDHYINPLNFHAVSVSLLILPQTKTEQRKNTERVYRVAVWGSDDFGMERDFTNLLTAKTVYDTVVDFTTQQHLKEMQFVRA